MGEGEGGGEEISIGTVPEVHSNGLRVGEVVKSKREDIDDKRMLIHIRSGKGKKTGIQCFQRLP